MDGQEAVVKLLLNQGAEIEAKDKRERTALHLAKDKRHNDVVKLLLDRGAKIRGRNRRAKLTKLVGQAKQAILPNLLG
jgi:ankyrin repeat protein